MLGSIQWDSNSEIVHAIEGVEIVCDANHFSMILLVHLGSLSCWKNNILGFILWFYIVEHKKFSIVNLFICISFLPSIMYHALSLKVVMHPQTITDPPPCFMIWWTCWGPRRSPSPIYHHDLPSKIKHIYLFLITDYHTIPIINGSILIPLCKPQVCKNMFTTQKRFPLLHLCTQSSIFESTPHNDVRKQFTCFISKLYCCCKYSSKSTLRSKSDTVPLLTGCKELWTLSSMSFNLTPYILPHMR